jgi:hypothetical protein
MAKRWVLHTETKGTGAQMVPLESVQKRAPSAEPLYVPPKRRPRKQEQPERRAPRRFRIVDVMTRQTVLEDGAAADAVAALRDVRRIADVDVYVWQEKSKRWRLISLAEQRALLDLAHG